jgi:radical SAM superfamily enzyme YgiQ (UPF0313 family)
MESFSFEQGPIRPPSEARSLLIRVTRNCPWNKCEFCNSYKGRRFSIRSSEEVRQDILTIRRIYDEIKSLSWRRGCKGEVTEEVIDCLCQDPRGYSASYLNVAMWLYYGEGSVFLQDGNNLAAKTEELRDVLTFLRENFPFIRRITTYARSKTIAKRRTLEELKALREAGLSRIHIGLESGSDEVLELIQKGVTAFEHVEAGLKVREAGLSLSEYIIPGLGGKSLWREHALETARVLNQINPDYIRLRTLRILDGTGLSETVARGTFEPLGDDEIVKEIQVTIENLDGITSCLVSDHILNLLDELQGKLPEDKPAMLKVIERFFELSADERCNFRLGRRTNIYRHLDDMKRPELFRRVEEAMKMISTSHRGGMEGFISDLTKQYI